MQVQARRNRFAARPAARQATDGIRALSSDSTIAEPVRSHRHLRRIAARVLVPAGLLWGFVRCAMSPPEPSLTSPSDEDDRRRRAAAEAIARVENLQQPPPMPPRPLTKREIAGLLQDANDDLHRLGVRRRPSLSPRGRLPPSLRLKRAYQERRALNYSGSLDQVRTWFSRAKFGTAEPGRTRRRGPLHPFDLFLVPGHDDQAWLHVVVPSYGFAPLDGVGNHRCVDNGQPWVLLSDRLKLGEEYVLYKRDGTQSIAHQWGRESVIEDVVSIARTYRERVGEPIGVGDISRLAGGKLPGHWTHKTGVDVDMYLLTYSTSSQRTEPGMMWHTLTPDGAVWSSDPDGNGRVEASRDDQGDTPTAHKLRTLAETALGNDNIVYFVHDDPRVLQPFDTAAQARRRGRRFLHAKNRGYWPPHRDHVHLRWNFGRLRIDDPPKP
ncbi:MAG: hypothetical protein B7733_22765 [Myxococcales bacterium FL481]|nr:MAG: hypothetical protein B7733_22765 [Myxococcales bacterium FL481]